MPTQNGSQTTAPVRQSTKLRELLAKPGIISCPGVYDGFSARIALDVGFDCLYMTGAGTCASKLGQPDLGMATMNDMREHAEMIANLDPEIPLIADADTGYGGPNMVARTVAAYARSGIAALHIEDQVQAKRCGHLSFKPLVERDVFESRIRAAAQARERIGSDIVIIARTDALASIGLEESVTRLKMAVAAGADVVFLEGVTSVEMARDFVKQMDGVPCLYNMVDWGVSPQVTAKEAEEMGFKIIIFPFAALAPAAEAIYGAFRHLKKNGESTVKKEYTPKRLFTIAGLENAVKIDKAAGGSHYDTV